MLHIWDGVNIAIKIPSKPQTQAAEAAYWEKKEQWDGLYCHSKPPDHTPVDAFVCFLHEISFNPCHTEN